MGRKKERNPRAKKPPKKKSDALHFSWSKIDPRARAAAAGNMVAYLENSARAQEGLAEADSKIGLARRAQVARSVAEAYRTLKGFAVEVCRESDDEVEVVREVNPSGWTFVGADSMRGETYAAAVRLKQR